MLVSLNALHQELPAILNWPVNDLCEAIAALGFPIDGVHQASHTSILDVDVTANRGDMMSHRGLARDLAAKLGVGIAAVDPKRLSEGPALVAIRLETEACPVYATAILQLGVAQQTPQKVKDFLASLGSTAKNLAAVDASNELLHYYGHPTHAFDADKLQGAVVVRFAKAGEKVVTLDGVERKLTELDLVIADDSGVIALAGVMGGESTKVTEGTRRVLLESAYFDPRTVRAMARRHSLHTDGSHRFGRGADPRMARVARDLFVERLQAWAGATLEGAWAVGAEPLPGPAIPLSKDLLQRIAGEPLPLEDAAEALRNLGCVVEENHVSLTAVAPSWRHDLAIPEDLAEEVLRLRGYDLIPSALPPVKADPEPLSPTFLQRRSLARRLACLGFHQTVTYGFISPEADAEFPSSPVSGRLLGNPLGLEYSVLRGSLLPSLKTIAEHNLRQGAREVKLFEIAPTFASSSAGPVETQTLTLVWAGETGGLDPFTPKGPVHPAALQGVLASIGAKGAKAEVRTLEGGFHVAEVALVDLPPMAERVIPGFQGFSRFPSSERDMSLVVPNGLSFIRLSEAMEAALAGTPLSLLTCVDIYRGKGLPEGTQAWLLRLVFQGDRTLKGEEVDAWVQSALEAAQHLGAELRG